MRPSNILPLSVECFRLLTALSSRRMIQFRVLTLCVTVLSLCHKTIGRYAKTAAEKQNLIVTIEELEK